MADGPSGVDSSSRAFPTSALEAPAQAWNSRREPEQGLAYAVEVSLDVARGAELGVLGSAQALLNKHHTGNSRLAVVQGDRRVRVASDGAGVFGTDFVYITDKTQEGFLYLSHSMRAFVHLRRPANDRPRSQLDLTSSVGGTRTIESRICREILFVATGPVPIHWRLWFCNDSDLSPFAYFAADVLTECPPAIAESVAAFGMPLRGDLTLGNPLAVSGPSSSFAVTNLSIRSVPDAEFNAPPGYTDLRGRMAKGGVQ